ncbi:MAG: discoidin domain-containing protein [Opitutales bacterium]
MKKLIISLSALAIATVAFAQDTKVLTLEIPTVQIVGTPAPIKLDNLDSKSQNPTPTVPADVTNIAKGKTVTSSDDFPLIGELELVTDGDKDASEGYYVELMDGVQWIQIDLAKESEIFAVAMWMYHSQARAYKDVVVQISNDAEFKTGVETIFNADHDNTIKLGAGKDKAWVQSNEGKLVALEKPLKAQYLRIYSNGNTANDTNHYIEVEVFGR